MPLSSVDNPFEDGVFFFAQVDVEYQHRAGFWCQRVRSELRMIGMVGGVTVPC